MLVENSKEIFATSWEASKLLIWESSHVKDLSLGPYYNLADSGDVDVLVGQGEILTTAEEYANAGIHELRARLLDQHGQPLWNLVELLADHRERAT